MTNPNEEAVDQFEELLRQLKVKYDLFFAGARKLPPSEDRRRLEALVHELSKLRMRENTLRFRFNTLLGRFNQYRELWGRQMREREEGPMDYRRRVAALSEAEPVTRETGSREERDREQQEVVTEREGQSYVKVTGSTTEQAAKRLYEEIAEAQKALGKGGLTLGQVEQIVRQQSDAMRSRFSVDEVGFRVEIVDGKVKLKAKPLQKGS
ncbi:MAG: MXAN_5187 C-terminal domain-containing protein [Thermoanaerobaculia bacterium]